MQRAIFLERDVVISPPPEAEYVSGWNKIKLLPGTVAAIRDLSQAGFTIIVVTNQPDVGMGAVPWLDLESMHARLVKQFADGGVTGVRVCYCPHAPKVRCFCRMPEPGLLLRAALELNLNLSASWMVGTSDTGIAVGKIAGCRTIWIVDPAPVAPLVQPDLFARDLPEAARQVLAHERQIQAGIAARAARAGNGG